MAVVKIEYAKLNYPVDILLTDFIKPEFIKNFDFDICKASMCFVNPHVKKEFPKNFSHLISRFVAELEFWADVHNNTYTYDTFERSAYQIERSFANHLPRIKNKYPGGKIILSSKGFYRDVAEKMMEISNLTDDLEKKDEKNNVAPIRKIVKI